jgi:hypothetical protein
MVSISEQPPIDTNPVQQVSQSLEQAPPFKGRINPDLLRISVLVAVSDRQVCGHFGERHNRCAFPCFRDKA